MPERAPLTGRTHHKLYFTGTDGRHALMEQGKRERDREEREREREREAIKEERG